MRRLIASLIAVLGVACNDRGVGDGIGRPAAGTVPHAPRIPVEITGVYLADGDPARRFAQLDLARLPCASSADCADGVACVNDACAITEAIDLAGLELCNGESCTPLSGLLDGPRGVCLGSPGPLATAGDLAVTDAAGTTHAYFAWGAEPSLIGTDSYLSDAYRAGLAAAGAFAPVAFPMPAGVAATRTGCAPLLGTPDCGAAQNQLGAADAGLCPRLASAVVLTEVRPSHADADESWVELYNSSPNPLPLFGARLCQSTSCVLLGRQHVIDGNDYLVVHLGTALPESADRREIAFEGASPIAEGAEVAFIAPGPLDAASASHLLSFVRYGDAALGRMSGSAADAGLWSDAAQSANAARLAGESVSAINPGGSVPSDWKPDLPTKLAPSDTVWDSCSVPEVPAPPSPLVISAVRLDSSAGAVVITNVSDATIQLSGWSLQRGSNATPLTDALDAGESRSFSGGVGADGEAALIDGGNVRQYVTWGTTDSSLLKSAALAAGAWPLATCSLAELATGGSHELAPGLPGQSPADYP